MADSVLGYLATRFSSSPENIATEALNFILGKSHIARSAFVNFVNRMGSRISSDLIFQTQAVGDEGAIPDIVGSDMDGNQLLMGESKFWAGLTDNQPVTYIKRLPSETHAILLFIAPDKRVQTLWPEMLHRCSEAGMVITDIHEILDGFISGQVNDFHFLGLCSWRALLNYINAEVRSHGLRDIEEDIQQLIGLCERMDSEAFLPLQSEELSPGNGLRYLHYHQIVDEVVENLVGEKTVSKKGLRATPTYAKYTRYIKTKNYGMSVQFNPDYWFKYRETPIWLTIKQIDEGSWKYSHIAKERLYSFEMEQPSRLLVDDKDLIVPLFLPSGKEKNEVVKRVVDQIKTVISLIED